MKKHRSGYSQGYKRNFGPSILFFAVVLLGTIAQPGRVQADLLSIFKGDDQAGQLAEAKANLRLISNAMETYSAANGGNYPSDLSDLVNSTPAYLNKNYCDVTTDGYTYTCTLTTATYTITATPEKGGQAISISTGGMLQ